MTTATAEAPATEPALLHHQFNAEGLCLDPEVVKITVPKGCACELRLAQDAAGGWRTGYRLATGPDDTLDTYPADTGDFHASRAAALLAAAGAALQWFEASPKSKLHKKCAGAVTAFLIAQEGSPANKKTTAAAGAQIPDPVNLDVPVEGLEPNPHNPRGEISAESVAELAEAIRAVGLLQPIGVRVIPDAGGLPGVGAVRRELLWGHRRLAAFQKLKRETIPARVYENITDDQARLLLLIENGQREDLNPIAAARGFADMMRDFELTQDDIAKAVKKSRPVVANALRLLELPADVQEMLADGRLTTAHGTALCRFKDWPAACSKIAELAAKKGASAGSLEKDLPFYEELTKAKVAVELVGDVLYEPYQPSFESVKKLAKSDKSIFAWYDKERYEDCAYTLNLQLGKDLLAAEKTRVEEDRKQADARDSDSGEGGSSGMTAAEKRERQKKIDENLQNRLETSAVHRASLVRLKEVEGLDLPSLFIVLREGLAHCPSGYLDDVAKVLGIKLPAGFTSYNFYAKTDKALAAMLTMKPVDALRVIAAGLAAREHQGAMNNAFELPSFVEILAREDAKEPVDPESYVAEWEEKILPLVKYGADAADVVQRLDCPQFIAEQMVRQIRRNIRSAGVPLLSKEDAAVFEKTSADKLGQVKIALDRGVKAAEVAQETGLHISSVQSLARVFAFEKAYDKAMRLETAEPKPAEKPKGKKPAAKAAKKGGKKK